eukprot:TRINITY_DN31978_c0_g1_i1.p1 TRINITY_DN31978_c0_g1~~TRINITY_DN31978_c0_g1_i1.p1  ORF type:complete len:240 (+),score=24.76 TRINITY_DN31978_c0_g1_i1:58-720(+)
MSFLVRMFRGGEPSSIIGPEEQIILDNVGMASVLISVLEEVGTEKFPIRKFGVPTFQQRRWLMCSQKLDLQKVMLPIEDSGGNEVVINGHCFCKLFEVLKDSHRSISKASKRKEGIVDNDDEDFCCVCMANLKDSVLPCSHAFCQECLSEWSCGRSTHTCPLCKDERANNMVETFTLSNLSPTELYESLSDSINEILKEPQCRANTMSALARWRMRRAFA